MSGNPAAGALLDWATQNTPDKNDPSYVPPRPMEKLDPGIIDMILGKPDAVKMKDALAIAIDGSKSEAERVNALDEIEMVLDSINMEVLKMWDPILALTASASSAIATQAFWVAGTAIQNNPKSQSAFLSHDPFPRLINALSTSTSADVRSKAMYCLSGSLKHHHDAVLQFSKAGGWIVIKACLSDRSPPVRRKAAFLLNALLISNNPETDDDPMDTSNLTRAAISLENIISTLTKSLVSPSGPIDEDYEEKAMRTIITYLHDEDAGTEIDEDGTVTEDVKQLLKERATARGKSWNLHDEDWQVLRRHAAL
ncbi:hsp70 nucleotide exchange factor fes1 [Tulasnella sp. 330]|nr:hsp70 nucleotide exchange factor fes1 [Tulasnella sp. 330]KAG8879272.1 hsp70 nucleotide exchange factor fes1 [Tulasnella sp. 331]KAG8881501.1 hsp70 nucleotide exchange factor fes1 [Tulasnella sp. 332]